MKLGKITLLWILIVLFIVLWVPYFQNIGTTGDISFFRFTMTFVSLYPTLLFLGVVLGFLLAIYVKSLITDISKADVKKFDL